MTFLQKLKPTTSKRYLLFLAALAWTVAGSFLLGKAALLFYASTHYFGLPIFFSSLGGLLFYLLLFSKLSVKHTQRILAMKNETPCFFSFFSLKSYVLMIVMIISGVLLRKSGFLSSDYLALVYLTMGIPLFLSSIRFYYYAINVKGSF